MIDVDKVSKSYMKQQMLIAIAIFLLVLLVMRIWYMDYLLTPAIIGLCFTLIMGVVEGMTWKRVAGKAADSLPTFYTAVSGGRFLLALAVMFIYYIVVGKESMLPFFLVFMAFYVVSLVHHAAFFTNISNKQ